MLSYAALQWRNSQKIHLQYANIQERVVYCNQSCVWLFVGPNLESWKQLRHCTFSGMPVNSWEQDNTCKIWGFHSGNYEEWRLLGCYGVWLL
jgi:hypothetical protein